MFCWSLKICFGVLLVFPSWWPKGIKNPVDSLFSIIGLIHSFFFYFLWLATPANWNRDESWRCDDQKVNEQFSTIFSHSWNNSWNYYKFQPSLAIGEPFIVFSLNASPFHSLPFFFFLIFLSYWFSSSGLMVLKFQFYYFSVYQLYCVDLNYGHKC